MVEKWKPPPSSSLWSEHWWGKCLFPSFLSVFFRRFHGWTARARSLSLSLSRRPAASRKEEKKEVAALALYNSCVCHTRQVLGLTQYSNAVRSLHAVQLRRCYFGLCRGLLSSCYGLACTLPVWCVFVCAVCVCPRGRARLSSCAWRALSSLSLSPCCIEYRILWNFLCLQLCVGNWKLGTRRYSLMC